MGRNSTRLKMEFTKLKKETLKELKNQDNQSDFLIILEMAVKLIKQKNGN